MPEGELARKFDIARCSKSPAMFDFFLTEKGGEDDFNPTSMSRVELKKFVNGKTKLNWLNNKYIRHMPVETLWPLAVPFIEESTMMKALLEKDPARIKRSFNDLRNYLYSLADIVPYMEEIFKEILTFENEEARAQLSDPLAAAVLDAFAELLNKNNPASPEEYSDLMKKAGEISTAKGKALFMTIRVATTGSMHGLELPNLFTLLGKELVLQRLAALREKAGLAAK
jgi:glutamyl-tRNA synthetase/nondiscriminating glutamyl-tRNA synthetase